MCTGEQDAAPHVPKRAIKHLTAIAGRRTASWWHTPRRTRVWQIARNRNGDREFPTRPGGVTQARWLRRITLWHLVAREMWQPWIIYHHKRSGNSTTKNRRPVAKTTPNTRNLERASAAVLTPQQAPTPRFLGRKGVARHSLGCGRCVLPWSSLPEAHPPERLPQPSRRLPCVYLGVCSRASSWCDVCHCSGGDIPYNFGSAFTPGHRATALAASLRRKADTPGCPVIRAVSAGAYTPWTLPSRIRCA